MIRLLRLILAWVPESALHAVHREAHHAWRLRRPAADWPEAEAGMRRAEVKDALVRAGAIARGRIVGDVEADLRSRMELALLIQPGGMFEHPTPEVRTLASILGWVQRKWQRGPVLVGLCETCEHAGRGAYHLDTDGCCSVCFGPFLADVALEQLAAGEDAPNTFRVDLDAAIRHPLRQEAPHA